MDLSDLSCLSHEELDLLQDLDNQSHQLLVGWAYLRSHLRRALVSGDVTALARLALPQALERVCRAARQTLPGESPPLQLLDVDWLDEGNVIYRVREADPSALSAALVGSGLLLEATVSLARGCDWRLRALRPATKIDPDQPLRDGLYAAALERRAG